MDRIEKGCRACGTWPCTCEGDEAVALYLEHLRKASTTRVSVENPRRPGRWHYFDVGLSDLVHTLDNADPRGKQGRNGRELTSINGIPIDQWRRDHG